MPPALEGEADPGTLPPRLACSSEVSRSGAGKLPRSKALCKQGFRTIAPAFIAGGHSPLHLNVQEPYLSPGHSSPSP